MSAFETRPFSAACRPKGENVERSTMLPCLHGCAVVLEMICRRGKGVWLFPSPSELAASPRCCGLIAIAHRSTTKATTRHLSIFIFIFSFLFGFTRVGVLYVRVHARVRVRLYVLSEKNVCVLKPPVHRCQQTVNAIRTVHWTHMLLSGHKPRTFGNGAALAGGYIQKTEYSVVGRTLDRKPLAPSPPFLKCRLGCQKLQAKGEEK